MVSEALYSRIDKNAASAGKPATTEQFPPRPTLKVMEPPRVQSLESTNLHVYPCQDKYALSCLPSFTSSVSNPGHPSLGWSPSSAVRLIEIPNEKTDIPLNFCITPTKIYTF